jgi:uncharacterized protein (TIGR02145 family)
MRLFTEHGLGRTLLLTAVLSVGAVCWVGCDAVDRMSLIGQWENVGNGSSMELFKEGTGVVDNETIHWGINGKRLIISDGTNTSTGDYKISGYVLTVAYPEGDAMWVRKGKMEDFKKKKAVEEEREKETKTSGGSRSGGGSRGSLIGQWVSAKGGVNLELFKDGTGVLGNESITWKTEGNRFVFSGTEKTHSGDYEVSGYIFTVTYPDDLLVTWIRKDSVEEYRRKKLEKVSKYFTDSRDGQKYRAVTIGGKTWMAQNLNYKTDVSFCYRDNDSYCDKYGRLYLFAEAYKICPTGWHLPSMDEWVDLLRKVGDDDAVSLKSESGWSNFGNGTDDFGFSALPAGYIDSDKTFKGIESHGTWWTRSTEGLFGNMRYTQMINDDNAVKTGVVSAGFVAAMSVRCVKDE